MVKSKNKITCIIGPFPPPVHGLSLINQFMVNSINTAGIDSIILNSRSINLKRSPLNILLRFLKMIKIVIQYLYLIVTNRIGTLYISLSGGWGQIYDILIIVISNVFKIKIFIHHHSFAYLNKKNIITKYILQIGRKRTTNIVLCDYMGSRLKEYNQNIKTTTISNSAFISNQKLNIKIKSDIKELNIGFLSNISFDKGIYEFIEVFKNFASNDKVNGLIAGPFSDNNSQVFLEEHLINLKNVKYIGSIADEKKHQFFKNIDILLFPTNYKNEAEPLVIHEAMSYGIPIIAKSRGCIFQMINPDSGMIIHGKEDFISTAYNLINKWLLNPEDLLSLKQKTQNHFNIQKDKSIQSLNNLIKKLKN